METDYLKHIDVIDATEMYNLMTLYGDDVFGFAYAITKNREQAKDIAQETFIKAYYKMHTFRGQSSFKTWLLAIARNLALNELKSSYFRKILLFESVNHSEVAPSAEAAFLRNQNSVEVWEIILRLSVKLREVLILDLEHELSINEMSSLLGLSEGTVKSRLFRARKAVEKEWRGRNLE
ncbi:RNA polymerase sigma factor [Paenibacillus sp. 2TAB26]|uniref:RNA polymerase sigma factor n=1 Tax=Paenibacillus sp. 2TAB26 TaxID=3233005 RepID=UPI003F962510